MVSKVSPFFVKFIHKQALFRSCLLFSSNCFPWLVPQEFSLFPYPLEVSRNIEYYWPHTYFLDCFLVIASHHFPIAYVFLLHSLMLLSKSKSSVFSLYIYTHQFSRSGYHNSQHNSTISKNCFFPSSISTHLRDQSNFLESYEETERK